MAHEEAGLVRQGRKRVVHAFGPDGTDKGGIADHMRHAGGGVTGRMNGVAIHCAHGDIAPDADLAAQSLLDIGRA